MNLLKVGIPAIFVAALATLIIADPFSGPRTTEQRQKDAELSGGKDAEMWLVSFDVSAAVEAYVQEHGDMPEGLAAIRPFLKPDSYELLNNPGNSARWTVNSDHVDDRGPINLEIEVRSGNDAIWESYLIKRQKR